MDLIANYEPRKITADRWAIVSGFVRATVAESYTDDDSLVAVRNAAGLLARLAEWVHIVHGHPLDATHVLDHELIEMFVAHGAVAVNVALIARFIGRGGTTGGAPVPPSPSSRRESGLDEAAAVPNAPPLAA